MTKGPRIIDLPRFLDHRGNLSVIEQGKEIPFAIRRVYWVYDVPGGEAREGHAYRKNKELIVALSGSFDVTVTDGMTEQIFSLNRSYYGLLVPEGYWRSLGNFSTNAVAMVITSEKYDETDYIFDPKELKELKEKGEL